MSYCCCFAPDRHAGAGSTRHCLYLQGDFDSPGSDRGSNSSLNAEYVVIRIGDNVSHSVSGWMVRDAAGHVYKLRSLRLGAGKQAIIHTGDGTSYTTSASVSRLKCAPLVSILFVC